MLFTEPISNSHCVGLCQEVSWKENGKEITIKESGELCKTALTLIPLVSLTLVAAEQLNLQELVGSEAT